MASTRSNRRGARLALHFGHTAVDRGRQLFQLDRFHQVMTRVETIGQSPRSRIGGTCDHNWPARAKIPMRGRIESIQQAQVEDQHLATPQRAKRAAEVGVESQATQTPRGDLGQPRIIVYHQHSRSQPARILDRAQVRQRFANVIQKTFGLGRRTVHHRQLQLGLEPSQRGSKAVQRRQQLRPG